MKLSDEARDLLAHLGRGGKWQHLWRADGKCSTWFEYGNPAPLPGDADIYFSVSPVARIPERIDYKTGQPKAPEYTRAANADICALNCLYAEFDAKDFGGSKEAALAHVNSLPIPPSVVVDSGNGYHCYWLFPKPVRVTDDNREALRRLQARWNAYVGGDPQAKDLARVLRLPGTYNSKYDPPRLVTFVWYNPDFTYLYGLERHLNQFAPEPIQPAPAAPTLPPVGTDRAARYWRAALEAELAELAAAPKGNRNGRLNVAALKLARLVGGGLGSEAEAIRGLTQTALSLGTDASFTAADITATIQSGFTAGLKRPKGLPNDRR
jgi:hypothetical protein